MSVRRNALSLIWAAGCLVLMASWARPVSATSFLRQFELNLDGEIFAGPGPFPATVDVTGFDFATGLGMVQLTHADSPGAHSVLALFDHEIDAATNTFFNEVGGAVGEPDAGQSWEVDEPGFMLGDLPENFVSGALDGAVGVSVFGTTSFPDDVATGLGWEFDLGPGETASLHFLVDTIAPAGFHLVQSDPDSGETLYLSSTLAIIPEPSTGLLVGLGLLGLGAARRTHSPDRRSEKMT